MRFHEHQRLAQRNSVILWVLFAVAVLSVVVITSGLMVLVFSPETLMTPDAYGMVLRTSLAVFGFVVLGAVFKSFEMKVGGEAVAKMLGGVKLSGHESTLREKTLINIVEEIAIASGTVVPNVYVLREERGINAFAAGHSMKDAVIGVTAGACEHLTREELQAVIAHEFSHIFHGDMALNMRAIKLIFGLESLSYFGHEIGRFYRHQKYMRADIKLVLASWVLQATGSVGVLFGNLIRAAISRQREYLADATAVQYTRNPTGLVQALEKIGGARHGAQLEAAHARDMSHGLFADGVNRFRASWFATHPPLDERIIRINPDWERNFTWVDTNEINIDHDPYMSFSQHAPIEYEPGARVSSATIDHVGEIEQQDLEQARCTIKGLPAPLHEAAHDFSQVRPLLYALLLESSVITQQLRLIRVSEGAVVAQMTTTLYQPMKELDNKLKWPLIELCLPTLDQCSKAQLHRMSVLIRALLLADENIHLFEWLLETVVTRHLHQLKNPGVLFNRRSKKMRQLRSHISVLLSGAIDTFVNEADREFVFAECKKRLPEVQLVRITSSPELTKLNQCIEALEQLHMLQKPRLLKVFQAALHRSDTPDEADVFLRALACLLDCPLPMSPRS